MINGMKKQESPKDCQVNPFIELSITWIAQLFTVEELSGETWFI